MPEKKSQHNGRQSSERTALRRIVYCNCSYAKVVPVETKKQVLADLCASGIAFDAVADLCEMSARKDPALKRIAGSGDVKIAACFPRAVKWLFHAGGAPLPETGIEVLNMRDQSAGEIVPLLLNGAPISEATA